MGARLEPTQPTNLDLYVWPRFFARCIPSVPACCCRYCGIVIVGEGWQPNFAASLGMLNLILKLSRLLKGRSVSRTFSRQLSGSWEN